MPNLAAGKDKKKKDKKDKKKGKKEKEQTVDVGASSTTEAGDQAAADPQDSGSLLSRILHDPRTAALVAFAGLAAWQILGK